VCSFLQNKIDFPLEKTRLINDTFIITMATTTTQATTQLNGHTTWYQVETDISIAKLYCEECDKYFVELVDAPHPCPLCEKEVEFKFDLTYSDIGKVIEIVSQLQKRDAINAIDWQEEMQTLNEYDWWSDSREQNQCMWIVLRDPPGFEKAREYFEQAYVTAYHRDDYC
jgi:hypothetical protein